MWKDGKKKYFVNFTSATKGYCFKENSGNYRISLMIKVCITQIHLR